MEMLHQPQIRTGKDEQNPSAECRAPGNNFYVRKTIARSIFPFPHAGRSVQARFKCMDMDGDAFWRVALFGGLFGAHKFATRRYLAGIGYFLTFGMCGVFYLADLLTILAENYWYWEVTYTFGTGREASRKKERIFCRPVTDRRFALISLSTAAITVVLGDIFFYLPLLRLLGKAVASGGMQLF